MRGETVTVGKVKGRNHYLSALLKSEWCRGDKREGEKMKEVKVKGEEGELNVKSEKNR